jgi:hypothetical protein
MGYTHYWRQSEDFTDDQWSAICKDTRKILTYCRKQGIAIQYECDDTRIRSCVTKSEIHFNGAGSDGCETFYIQFGNPRDFNFCKTERRPYDLAVCLCLLRISHHCSAFSISSDGKWDTETEWGYVRETYAKIFKEQPPKFQ